MFLSDQRSVVPPVRRFPRVCSLARRLCSTPFFFFLPNICCFQPAFRKSVEYALCFLFSSFHLTSLKPPFYAFFLRFFSPLVYELCFFPLHFFARLCLSVVAIRVPTMVTFPQRKRNNKKQRNGRIFYKILAIYKILRLLPPFGHGRHVTDDPTVGRLASRSWSRSCLLSYCLLLHILRIHKKLKKSQIRLVQYSQQ
jgi:hypothetical protein